MLFDQYEHFIDEVYKELISLGIKTNELRIDHLGYQASSNKDYDLKIEEVKDISEHISENIVGDRRVSILKLYKPFNYKYGSFEVFEIFEPKKDQVKNSEWEHIEFLVNKSLESFMTEYPELKWDTSILNREEFPQLVLHLGKGMRVKFPRRGVLEELKRV